MHQRSSQLFLVPHVQQRLQAATHVYIVQGEILCKLLKSLDGQHPQVLEAGLDPEGGLGAQLVLAVARSRWFEGNDGIPLLLKGASLYVSERQCDVAQRIVERLVSGVALFLGILVTEEVQSDFGDGRKVVELKEFTPEDLTSWPQTCRSCAPITGLAGLLGGFADVTACGFCK